MRKLLAYILRFIKRTVKAILPHNMYVKMYNWFLNIRVLHNRNVKIPELGKMSRGVNLFYYSFENSAGVVSDLLKLALESEKIPCNAIDLRAPEKFAVEIKDKTLFNTNIIVCHAASRTPATMLLLGIDLKKHYNICYWSWELSEVPDEYCSGLDIFQEFWTMSSFCTNALAKKTSVPVLTVPLYANPDRSVIENGRQYYNISKNVFLFMVAYDCNSFVSRKNPQAAVKAYIKAFSSEDSGVGLLLKIAYSENHQEHIEELQKTLEEYHNIYFIDKFISDAEMRTLVKASDAYVTLHRSEGLGLIPLEAMGLGTPVISTAWSGNMEYMTHMNTALVGYNLVPVAGQYVGSIPGDGLVWAEPDVNEAAELMRRMVADKNWREKLIANGKYTADEIFNATNISKTMHSRLKFLKLV